MVFRHFGRPDARQTALRLREVTAGRGVRLLIGMDADLAEAIGADGMHLPERALDQAPRLSEEHPDWLITGAAHAGSALDAPGLHARVLSPLFAAGGASSATPSLGLAAFGSLAASASRPVYALGGIDAKNARSLIGSGACGIAGVSAIQAAFDA
jgi:thiamine-phosphate pyrophosphorylase